MVMGKKKYKLSIEELRSLRTAATVGGPPVSIVERVVLPEVRVPLRWTGWDRCALCGTDRDITVDHIVPLRMGGWNCASNKQPLCFWCNQAKGGEWVRSVVQYELILLDSLGRQGRTGELAVVRGPAGTV